MQPACAHRPNRWWRMTQFVTIMWTPNVAAAEKWLPWEEFLQYWFCAHFVYFPLAVFHSFLIYWTSYRGWQGGIFQAGAPRGGTSRSNCEGLRDWISLDPSSASSWGRPDDGPPRKLMLKLWKPLCHRRRAAPWLTLDAVWPPDSNCREGQTVWAVAAPLKGRLQNLQEVSARFSILTASRVMKPSTISNKI